LLVHEASSVANRSMCVPRFSPRGMGWYAWYAYKNLACLFIGAIVRQLDRRNEATGRFGAAPENTRPKRRGDRRDRQATYGQEVRAPDLDGRVLVAGERERVPRRKKLLRACIRRLTTAMVHVDDPSPPWLSTWSRQSRSRTIARP